MSGFLIDTNVISEYGKPNPNSQVMIWFERADPNDLCASVITLGEIRVGIEDLPAGKRRADLENWLETGLPNWFDANLLSVTRNIADLWGKLTIQAKRQGTMLHTSDGLIAATALEHGLTRHTQH